MVGDYGCSSLMALEILVVGDCDDYYSSLLALEILEGDYYLVRRMTWVILGDDSRKNDVKENKLLKSSWVVLESPPFWCPS